MTAKVITDVYQGRPLYTFANFGNDDVLLPKQQNVGEVVDVPVDTVYIKMGVNRAPRCTCEQLWQLSQRCTPQGNRQPCGGDYGTQSCQGEERRNSVERLTKEHAVTCQLSATLLVRFWNAQRIFRGCGIRNLAVNMCPNTTLRPWTTRLDRFTSPHFEHDAHLRRLPRRR